MWTSFLCLLKKKEKSVVWTKKNLCTWSSYTEECYEPTFLPNIVYCNPAVTDCWGHRHLPCYTAVSMLHKTHWRHKCMYCVKWSKWVFVFTVKIFCLRQCYFEVMLISAVRQPRNGNCQTVWMSPVTWKDTRWYTVSEASPCISRGLPTRMVYLYNDIQSKYTILIGNP